MTSLIEHIKDKKIYYIAGMGIGITLATFVWLGIRKNAFEVQLDGQKIGVVKTKEEAQLLLAESIEAVENTVGKDIAVCEEILAIPVHSKKRELTPSQRLKEQFEESITYEVNAVEILVDGEVMAVVESEEVGQRLLEQIALRQLPQGSKIQLVEGALPEVKIAEAAESSAEDKSTEVAESSVEDKSTEAVESSVEGNVTAVASNIVVGSEQKPINEIQNNEAMNKLFVEGAIKKEKDAIEIHVGEVERAIPMTRDGKPLDTVQREYKAFDFNEDLKLKQTYVEEDKIMTEEEALDVLLSNTDEVVRYVLEPGDNVWDIAISHGTTMDRILEINPHITDVTRMQIGEEIKVEAPDPIISVATSEVAVFNEIIPADIEYVEDKNIYKGEEKVRQEGNDGVKELTVSVDKVNGKEISRTHLAEKILREPTTKIIAYGTKEKPKNAGGASVTPGKKGTFMHPLNGKGRISSQYGSRWGSFHRGIDIAASAGTPIYAAASGTVIYSGYNSGGFGNLIMIDHGNGYQTYYAHNSKNFAKVGQKVSKGQNIGAVGSTGNSTGNHVHFEIRKNGKPINPYSYIY